MPDYPIVDTHLHIWDTGRLRINDRWRICFVWRDGNAWEVEIVDYH